MNIIRARTARLPLVAVILVLILVGTGFLIDDGPAGIRDEDTSAVRWLAGHRTAWLVRATEAATWLADTWIVIAATAVLAAVAAWRTRAWWLPGGIILLTAGETAIYEISNALVARPRPAVERLDPGDPMASYPSGHVAASVCLYGGLALILLHVARRHPRPGRGPGAARVGAGRVGAARTGAAQARVARAGAAVAVAAAVAVPLIVAFCRTYRGMHHPSDVLAGAFLGACWLAAVHRGVLARAFAPDGREGRSAGLRPIGGAARPAHPM
ncbi:phosphatase PAP2 family protein [Parafrankia discariae]|uniref:phosphatase PAP2 family protein n=1 Tax=Parafrankia discariae TaxID=365528 RepID=UPI00035C8CFB|nr:phosphatase PAP2 family protein [Parafrankia discariae]